MSEPDVITIVAQKGGAGKTTIATNLAVEAARAGRRTLILDTDPQGSAVTWHDFRDLPYPEVRTSIHHNARNSLAQKRISLDAEIADTRLRLRRVLEAIELAPTSPALISRLSELEQALERQEAEAVDLLKFGLPAPAPNARDILLQKAALLRDALSSPSNPHFHRSSLHLQQLLEGIELSPGVSPEKRGCASTPTSSPFSGGPTRPTRPRPASSRSPRSSS